MEIESQQDFYSSLCYSFLPKEKNQHHSSPVEVLLPREDHCGGCGRHLFTLFDINLKDPALAFLGVHGSRLRIAFCPTCTTIGERVFTDIDLDGFSQWSLSNGEEPVDPLEDLNDWEDFPELPSQALMLGPARHPSSTTAQSYRQKGLSQFGGFPTWVQDADVPSCPQCQHPMLFVGQLSSFDLIEDAEGIFYAFLCALCGKSATVFQTT